MEFTVSMDGMTSQLLYKYVSLFMLGLAYVPQIKLSYSNGTPMNDFSYISLGMLATGGLLWSLYLYENEELRDALASFFLTFNIFALISMKIHYYIQSVRDHYKTYGDPSAPIDPAKVAMSQIIEAKMKEKEDQGSNKV